MFIEIADGIGIYSDPATNSPFRLNLETVQTIHFSEQTIGIRDGKLFTTAPGIGRYAPSPSERRPEDEILKAKRVTFKQATGQSQFGLKDTVLFFTSDANDRYEKLLHFLDENTYKI